MRLISTRTHGVLDYLTAGALIALPRAMGWSRRVTGLLTGAAALHVGYSLVTNYELGLVRLLPMRAHLAMDAVAGAALAAAPLMMDDEPDEVRAALLGIGLFELATTFSTDPDSSTATLDQA